MLDLRQQQYEVRDEAVVLKQQYQDQVLEVRGITVAEKDKRAVNLYIKLLIS